MSRSENNEDLPPYYWSDKLFAEQNGFKPVRDALGRILIDPEKPDDPASWEPAETPPDTLFLTKDDEEQFLNGFS